MSHHTWAGGQERHPFPSQHGELKQGMLLPKGHLLSVPSQAALPMTGMERGALCAAESREGAGTGGPIDPQHQSRERRTSKQRGGAKGPPLQLLSRAQDAPQLPMSWGQTAPFTALPAVTSELGVG